MQFRQPIQVSRTPSGGLGLDQVLERKNPANRACRHLLFPMLSGPLGNAPRPDLRRAIEVAQIRAQREIQPLRKSSWHESKMVNPAALHATGMFAEHSCSICLIYFIQNLELVGFPLRLATTGPLPVDGPPGAIPVACATAVHPCVGSHPPPRPARSN